MGTITKYYPFIDEETKSILDNLMDESNNYYDFVGLLSETVLENEAPINLGYLAAVNVWWTRKKDVIDLIQQKYKNIPYMRPWKYIPDITDMDQQYYHDQIVQAIDTAIKTPVEDWIETELHLLHAYFHYPFLGDVPGLLKPLENARNLLNANPKLKCFESLICTLEGWAKGLEGYVDDTIAILQKGLQLAEHYNDSLYRYLNLIDQVGFLLYVNVNETIELCESLYDIAQDLGVPYFMSEVLNDSAIVFETAGEYDLAISSHIEAKKISGENDWSNQILSRIYAALGDGSRALDVIAPYFKADGTTDSRFLYMRRARAFALLNRIEEAEYDLERYYGMVMKSGTDIHLGAYHHLSGYLEMAKGNYLAALDILEKCWEFYQRVPRVLNRNYILLDLTRVELELEKETGDTIEPITPGKWLCKLESHALERNLPGIRMQAALLKSEFYQNHDQLRDARATLIDALEITDSLGVATLRKRINTKIQEVDQLIQATE